MLLRRLPEARHEHVMDTLHPLMNVVRKTLRSFCSISFAIIEAPRQRLEFFIGFLWKHEVARVAPHDSQGVNQVPQKEIRRMQDLVLGLAEDFELSQTIECVERIRNAQLGILLAMEQLQVLCGVLDVDDAARAILHIDVSQLDQLAHLSIS